MLLFLMKKLNTLDLFNEVIFSVDAGTKKPYEEIRVKENLKSCKKHKII